MNAGYRLLDHTADVGLIAWGPDPAQAFTEAARGMRAAGRRGEVAGMLFHPPAKFLTMYLLRLGFLDGAAGFIVAALGSYYVFLKYAKLWELNRTSR